MSRKTLLMFALGVIGVSALACAGGATAPTVEPTLPAQGPAAPTRPPAGSSGPDLSSLNVCELVTPEEVAGLAGGTSRDEPNQSSDATFSMCWYELDAAGGAYEYYIVYVESAEMGQLAIDMEAGDIGDPVPGLGDQAYVRFVEDEDQFRLIVIRGDIALDMAGTRAEVLQEIASLLLERLDS